MFNSSEDEFICDYCLKQSESETLPDNWWEVKRGEIVWTGPTSFIFCSAACLTSPAMKTTFLHLQGTK